MFTIQRTHSDNAVRSMVAAISFACFVSANIPLVNAQTSSGSGVELLKSVGDIAMKVVSADEAPAQLKVLRGSIDGGPSDARWERHFQRLENGLWGLTVVSSGRVTSIRRWITLEGIVSLAGVGEIATQYDNTMLLPIGRSFVPFTTAKEVRAGGSQNTTALSGNLEGLIRPTLGAKTSYEQTYDSVSLITTTGLFGSSKTISKTYILRQTCTTENEEPASSLHPKLRGSYLLVSCDGGLDNGSTRSERFAYLRDSKLFVLLQTSTNGNGEKYKISEVEYAN